LRQLKRLSVPELAEAAGISKGYLWQLENGEESNPSLAILTQIAAALDTTVAAIVGFPVLRVKAGAVPDTLPPGLKEFLDRRRRQGTPVREDIVRALAQLQARDVRKDWAFLYEMIERTIDKRTTP
jgi:transcriptional regulator with XRE-family HTH domain